MRSGNLVSMLCRLMFPVILGGSLGVTLSVHAAADDCASAVPDSSLAREGFAGGTVAFLPVEQTTDESEDSVIAVVYYHSDQQCRPQVIDDYGINGGFPQLETSFIHTIRGKPNLFAIVSWPLSHAGLGMSGRYYDVYAYERSGETLAVNTFVTHHPVISGGIVGTVEGESSTFEGTTERGLIALMGSQGKWTWQASCNPDGNQAELTACSYVEQIEAGEKLEAVRQRLHEQHADDPELQAEELERFDKAQLGWRAQLKHDLDALFPLAPGDDPSYLYGSSYSARLASTQTFLIRQRAEFLRTYWLIEH